LRETITPLLPCQAICQNLVVTLSMSPTARTDWVLRHARALDFNLCGVAPAKDWPELERLPEWLGRGHAGEMRYLHDPRRQSPQSALPGAKSVIVCAINYNTTQPHSTDAPINSSSEDSPRGWISRYAWGTDYHEVLGAKLEALVTTMRTEFADPFDAKWYVDTGPVHERAAAHHAGLGWLAKNTLLINPEIGSWIFLGVILTTLDLAPSLAHAEAPPPDLCGQCTLCIDACPTGAIIEPYVLDARRCISYLTIELRGEIPEEFRGPMGRHVFGCDICQDVCPWNRRAPSSNESSFAPRDGLLAPDLEWLASLTEEEFRKVFHESPVKRTKWRGLIRNACVALGNSGVKPGTPAHDRVTKLLSRLAASDDALISKHAGWAIARLHRTQEAG
jgi:epoxyqueuosine reductase